MDRSYGVQERRQALCARSAALPGMLEQIALDWKRLRFQERVKMLAKTKLECFQSEWKRSSLEPIELDQLASWAAEAVRAGAA